MFSSYSSSMTNNYILLYFVRAFIHLTVLASLIVYQFLYALFVNPYLSISLYALCSVVLLFDGLYLFFYKDNKIFNRYFNLILVFFDAVFFVILFTILEFSGLAFVLFLIFLEIVALSLFSGWIFGILFSFLLSLLFSLSFVWQGDFSYESRKSLITLVSFSLFMSVIFGYFLSYAWEKLKRKMSQMEESIFFYRSQLNRYIPRNRLESPLHLSRKIRASLNSLLKFFLETKQKNIFPSYYENQLKHLQKFIGKYINYLEMEEYAFKSAHLPQLLENLLKKLQNHKDRPSSLEEKLEYKSSIDWMDCSAKQLEIAIENIIENSYQALKNKPNPKINILIYDEKEKIVLEFIDNGHGIEESDQENLFDPLFSKRFDIGGVGLAYALKVVKAHKGEINIISSPQGTRVIIKIPVLPVHKSKMSLTA